MEQSVHEHINIFRTSLSSGPQSKVKPFKIVLTKGVKPTRVRLLKYSQEQRAFLDKFASDLGHTGMVYANPTSIWVSAPLIVPKTGPAKIRFTADLRPINKYTVRSQHPMPDIEQELLKLAGSNYFATSICHMVTENFRWMKPLKSSNPSSNPTASSRRQVYHMVQRPQLRTCG